MDDENAASIADCGGCGRAYRAPEWDALTFVSFAGSGDDLAEVRACACGATVSRLRGAGATEPG